MSEEYKNFNSFQPSYSQGSQNGGGGGGGGDFGGGGGNSQEGGGYSQGGGGFVQGGGGYSQGTQGSPGSQRDKPKRDTQSLIPVTIRQLLGAENRANGKQAIDGKELAQITFLGVILSVEVQATNINYFVDDGSGKINVRQYVDIDEGGDDKQQPLSEKQYVRIVGNLRSFSDEFTVVGFKVFPVNDKNEITFHNLEVIKCHLVNTQQAAAGGGDVSMSMSQSQPVKAEGGQGQTQGGMSMNNNNNNGNNNNGGGNIINANGQVGQGSDNAMDFNQRVLKVFEGCSDNSDTGLSIQSVCDQLGGSTRDEIRKAVEYLSEEGHLYSTVDEEHYKSTG